MIQYTFKINILKKLYKFLPNLYHSIINKLIKKLHLKNNNFLIKTYKNLSKTEYFYIIPTPKKNINNILKTIIIYIHNYKIKNYFK